MNKGIFYIPLYQQKKDFSDILDEIILTIKFVDKKKFSEVYQLHLSLVQLLECW